MSWPGYGTIEAVVLDPQHLIGTAPPSGTATPVGTTPQQRLYLYTPELNLLAETELTTSSTPNILYEYVWFNGHPVAQIDGGTAVHWTFTDHLGTPMIQTDTSGNPFWRGKYEPFGSIFQLRTADQHQPLRLPGQEAEQFNLGGNGLTTKSYNIFRWYQPRWGRYAEADPLGVKSGTNLYLYSFVNPESNSDPTGLITCRCQRHLGPIPIRLGVIAHDYLRIGPASRCEDNPAYGFFPNQRIPFGFWFFSPHGELVFGGTDRKDEACEQLPCVNDGKALNAVAAKASSPGMYCILGLNCYNMTDSILAKAWTHGCCPAIPPIPPSFGLKGFGGR
jgi:RHS repeat-associated protein